MTRAKDISKIVTDANLSGTLDVTGTVTGSGVVRAGDDTSSMQIQKSGVNGFINMNDTGGIIYRLGSSFTERMRIDSSGRVGIGTSSPNSRLTSATTDGGSAFSIHRDFSGDVGASETGTGSFNFTLTDTATTDQIVSRINSVAVAGTGDAFAGSMRFYTAGTNGSIAERMRIDSSGNVGIGTSSPNRMLSLENGDLQIHETGSSDPLLQFSVGNTQASPTQSFSLRIDNSDSDKFQLINGTSGEIPLTVDTSGKVGIGTSSPSTPLHIQASGQNAHIRLQASDNGYASRLQLYANNVSGASYNAIQSHVNGDGTVQWEISGPKASAEDQMLFSTGGTERMRISSGGQLSLATTDTTHGFNVGQSGTDFRGRFQGNNQYRLALQNGTNNLVWLGSGGADNFRVSNSSGSTLMEVTSSGQVVASSFSGGGLGKIAQVQNVEKLDTFSTNTTSPDGVAITGMQVNITPSSTSSKVLVTVSLGAIGCSTSSSRTTTFQLYRGATQIAEGNASGSRPRVTFRSWMTSGDTNHALGGLSFSFLDSPSSTSALSYKLHMSGSHASDTFYLNRSGADSDGSNNYQSRTISTMQCMEVLA